jgi:hypothetical protein
MTATPLEGASHGAEIDCLFEVPCTCLKACLHESTANRLEAFRAERRALAVVALPARYSTRCPVCCTWIRQGRLIVRVHPRPQVTLWVHLTCAALWDTFGAVAGVRL